MSQILSRGFNSISELKQILTKTSDANVNPMGESDCAMAWNKDENRVYMDNADWIFKTFSDDQIIAEKFSTATDILDAIKDIPEDTNISPFGVEFGAAYDPEENILYLDEPNWISKSFEEVES